MRRDRVTPELHAAVLVRDKGCILAKLEPGHQCRDRWGFPHAADRLELLTIEHVKDQPRMGRRAKSDLAHCVAICAASNIGVPSKAQRQLIRAYLERVEAVR